LVQSETQFERTDKIIHYEMWFQKATCGYFQKYTILDQNSDLHRF